MAFVFMLVLLDLVTSLSLKTSKNAQLNYIIAKMPTFGAFLLQLLLISSVTHKRNKNLRDVSLNKSGRIV